MNLSGFRFSVCQVYGQGTFYLYLDNVIKSKF